MKFIPVGIMKVLRKKNSQHTASDNTKHVILISTNVVGLQKSLTSSIDKLLHKKMLNQILGLFWVTFCFSYFSASIIFQQQKHPGNFFISQFFLFKILWVNKTTKISRTYEKRKRYTVQYTTVKRSITTRMSEEVSKSLVSGLQPQHTPFIRF